MPVPLQLPFPHDSEKAVPESDGLVDLLMDFCTGGVLNVGDGQEFRIAYNLQRAGVLSVLSTSLLPSDLQSIYESSSPPHLAGLVTNSTPSTSALKPNDMCRQS